MILWMKDYNQDKKDKDKIHFIGIDNQLDAYDIGWLIEYFSREFKSFVDENNSMVAEMMENSIPDYSGMKESEFNKRLKLLEKFRDQFKSHTRQLHSDQERIADRAIHLLDATINSHNFLYEICNSGNNLRDYQLSRNVLWIYDRLGDNETIAVWAHNAHIANNPDYYGANDPSMGKYLEDVLGIKYLKLSTSFSIGKFTAVMLDSLGNDTDPLTCQISDNPPAESVNYLFHQAKYPNFVFNINMIDVNSLLFNFLDTLRPMIGVGDLYLGSPELHFTGDRISRLTKAYDIIFYFSETNPLLSN